MILFGSYTSPFVRHCRIVLDQTGKPWSMQDTDYATSGSESPTKRVPYLRDDKVHLYDSSSILHYLREQMGQAFLPNFQATENYAMANTVLDTAINLFLLENNGLKDESNDFIQRQQGRVHSGLQVLNALDLPKHTDEIATDDVALRIACLLDWADYRQRFEVADYAELQRFLTMMRDWKPFLETAPPD